MLSLMRFFVGNRDSLAKALPIIGLLFVAACTDRLVDEMPSDSATRQDEMLTQQPHRGVLRVMSLNLAHGRRDGVNQILLKEQTFRDSLDAVAALLYREHVDILALQEADGPSRWSGGFDHVGTLAQIGGYPWHERASHAKNWLFDYGTALISRVPFIETVAHTFQPSPPTLNKGMLLAQIAWQGKEVGGQTYLVDVVSVHLDFSRRKVREQQIEEMLTVLAERVFPIIVMGDFNSDWFSQASVVRVLAQRADLQVFRPDAKDLGTYGEAGHRYDWILISDELEFKEYKVLPDVVSDHRAVVAEIGLRQSL
jgi:endonuclease/exonuclease/phosphatase family metal-dependent hydrolase